MIELDLDYSILCGKIVEKFGTQYNFSLALGLSERSLSLKLNNKRGWRQEEILKSANLLDITINEIPMYFFHSKVQ